MDILCLMFECEERGVLASSGQPWSDDEIAAAVSGPTDVVLSCIAELLTKGVASRNQAGAVFSRRMVREERERERWRKSKQGNRAIPADFPQLSTPIPGVSSVSSSSSVSNKNQELRKKRAELEAKSLLKKYGRVG